jgi:RNA polymerase sigma-70 factor (ECF subfamily)
LALARVGPEPESFEPVLRDVARGDRVAVSRCIAIYGSLVWSLARRMSATTADAEDAVQEIFLDLWRSAGRFDPARGPEHTFVVTIARRRLIDRLRAQRARLTAEVPATDELVGRIPSPDPGSEQDADLAAAWALLAELPAEHRKIVQLSLLQGLSHAEIAAQLGRPLGTVKTVLRRSLLRVRHALRERFEPVASARRSP